MVKKLLAFLLLIFNLNSFSQEKNIIILGKVSDSISVIKNANIINLKTKQGTFSNDTGQFRIFVSLGDTLTFSSIQHLSKKILINKKIVINKRLNVILKQNTYELDSFELKRHDLLGRLTSDTKSVPVDSVKIKMRGALDFSMIDFTEKDYTIDANIRSKAPIANTMAGAIPMAFKSKINSKPFKSILKERALKKDLRQREAFPYKILSELGEKFFFDQLKIPVDKYFHFLEYCNPLGIEKLHKDGKQLELIKILIEESKTYHKIIKKE